MHPALRVPRWSLVVILHSAACCMQVLLLMLTTLYSVTGFTRLPQHLWHLWCSSSTDGIARPQLVAQYTGIYRLLPQHELLQLRRRAAPRRRPP